MPSLDVLAAPKMMAHLKAGSGNANEHFGGAKPVGERGDGGVAVRSGQREHGYVAAARESG